MYLLLYILSVGAALVGFALLLIAKSVFHEQLGGLAFLIGCVFFCAAPIVQLLDRISRQIDDRD